MTDDADEILNAYHGLWLLDEIWRPAAERAAPIGRAKGLPRPEGCDGYFSLGYRVGQEKDWPITWSLCYRQWKERNVKGFLVARWRTDWLPEDRIVSPRNRKPCRTTGKPVKINHHPNRESPHEWEIKAFVDETGMPLPVPCHVWQALGLDWLPVVTDDIRREISRRIMHYFETGELTT